ncbi:hypothetical protein OV079_35680 [Nannocystis pusilla]|uniref:Uncharacterized protein n=1 Tax=Nannocystis pusilla TaxID=889268 RepID=A0A9X3EWV1_9BACT|nr:hypothetical protein [Nannocystis pusilla]MCY1010815.1 hypothetical protein [Nannocystis pusilla]
MALQRRVEVEVAGLPGAHGHEGGVDLGERAERVDGVGGGGEPRLAVGHAEAGGPGELAAVDEGDAEADDRHLLAPGVDEGGHGVARLAEAGPGLDAPATRERGGRGEEAAAAHASIVRQSAGRSATRAAIPMEREDWLEVRHTG